MGNLNNLSKLEQDQEKESRFWQGCLKFISAIAVIIAAIIGLFEIPVGQIFQQISNRFLATQTPIVITATFPSTVVKSESTTQTVAPPITPTKINPTNTPRPPETPTQIKSGPEYIDRIYTGAGNKVAYEKSLNDDEVIVGSAWGFNWGAEITEGSCVAFIIKGSGTFPFTVIDGVYEVWGNVKTEDEANQLLNQQVEILKRQKCNDQNIQRVRKP